MNEQYSKHLVNQKAYKPSKIDNYNMLPGDPKGLPDEFYSHNLKGTLVFIDSNFLSKVSEKFGNGKYLSYDLITFSDNLAGNQNLFCHQIYYYTAPPFQSSIPSKDEERKKDGYDRFINKLRVRKVIIRGGRCQRLKIDGRFEYHQKGVDILLAIDLMSVPIKFPHIEKIILIASDSDFVPTIKNLQEQGIKIILYTYYEKKRDTKFSRNNHLIKSVYKYVLLSVDDFYKAPLIKYNNIPK